ncbi:uncharacterized protein LOC135327662 [Dromaius novaehollandiae]|uniref:uncharacterized protein LOC135327662 n=1 Tax=Dromaius novaehollandiae TaxID=8790 RepID=UPI00311E3A64
MAKADDAVEMPTLGRPFQLGMLYDCRKETLIPGITLWDLDTLRNYEDVRSQNKTEFQIIASDSLEDKSSALGVSSSLKASFLSGLVEVSGSAEYLRDSRSSKRQARVTLQYSTTTQFKQLTMNQLGRKNISYPDVFDQGTATHVVIAVLYGAQAFFVFDREVSEKEDIQEIQGSLKLTISGIPTVQIEGEGSVKMDEKTKSFTEKFSCRFHGDFALESNPVTYQDAMRVYAALPKMLGANGEKAVPVKVWLYPLTKLDSKAARLVREISLALVFDAQCVSEQLAELDMRCNDLQRNPVATSFPEIKRKLQQFKDLCKQHRQAFQRELAGVLPCIRGGGKEEGVLAEILIRIGNSPFNIQRLNEFLNEKEQEMNFMKVFIAVLTDATLVSSRSELQRIVLDPTRDLVMSFTFTSLEEEEPYLLELNKWLRCGTSHVNPSSTDAAPGERDPKQWFENTEIYTKVRELAKAFTEFATANKPEGKTHFVISSVPDKSHPGATIYLYEAGVLVSSDFEPPAKPLPCQPEPVGHDSVRLALRPSAFGRAAVCGYRVEYGTAEERDWRAVEAGGDAEAVTVTGLAPNTHYVFRYAARSRAGCGPSSPESFPAKTLPASPPGRPARAGEEPHAVALSWAAPAAVGPGAHVEAYRVEYLEEQAAGGAEAAGGWRQRRTDGAAPRCRVEGLEPQTPYRFRVAALCGAAGESRPGPEAALCTAREPLPAATRDCLGRGAPVAGRQPALYALPPDGAAGGVAYRLGARDPPAPGKVVLLLGAAGAGKSTLLDAALNHLLGVQWEDGFRFTLGAEAAGGRPGQSRTPAVRACAVGPGQGLRAPCALTLVDTPGLGDARGVRQDRLLARQLHALLSGPGGFDRVDAVGLVVPASPAGGAHAQRYVFDAALSLLGNDLRGGLQLLVTSAPGPAPLALEAAREAELPVPRDADGRPVHFRFDLAGLFASNAQEDEEERNRRKAAWKRAARGLAAWLEAVLAAESRDLALTKEVLAAQVQLEGCARELPALVRAGLAKLQEMRRAARARCGDPGRPGARVPCEPGQTLPVPAALPCAGARALNCHHCNYTCRRPRPAARDADKLWWAALGPGSGACTACPGRCCWYVHLVQPYRFERGAPAAEEPLRAAAVPEELRRQYAALEEGVRGLASAARGSLQRLRQLALRPGPLSSAKRLELLLRAEERERRPGHEERAEALREEHAALELLRRAADGEALLPRPEDLFEGADEPAAPAGQS